MKHSFPFPRLRSVLFGLACALFAQQSASAQDYFSYYHGQKIPYGIATDQVVVKLKSAEALRLLPSLPALGPQLGQVESYPLQPGLASLHLKPGKGAQRVQEVLAALRARPEVVFASPMLTNQKGTAVGAVQNEVVVQLKPSTTLEQVNALARRTGISQVKPYEFDPHTFYLVVPNAQTDVLRLANQFFETGLFEYAEPNFLRVIGRETNDPLYNNQWNHFNNGQYGGLTRVDMSVNLAWNTPNTCRGTGIKVAIIDEGVDLGHPDLAANINPGFDATGNGSNGAPTGGDTHGTSCAGIVAAVADNGIGVAGVAPNARIVPIRALIGGYLTGDNNTASALDWAWQNNRADVISCSWKMNSPSSLVEAAINRAVTQGRNYWGTPLGCLVLFAAGNDNGSVSFPASVPSTIAVGALNMCGRRKAPNDCTNESWGSNYGTGLDLVAPGVKIPTTTTGGGYTTTFNGTSSACPNAAGVAALVLSANPGLSQAQARFALEDGVDKSPWINNSYPYQFNTGVAGQPNGSWNNELGYGRVNAARAVGQVTARLGSSLTAIGHYCTAGPETFRVVNPPTAGTAITWSSSNPYVLTIDPSTGVATRGQDDGFATISAAYTSPTCGATTLSQNVYVGDLANEAYGLFATTDDYCTNTTIRYYMEWPSHEPTGVGYVWDVKGQGMISWQGTLTYNNEARTVYVDVTPRTSSNNPRYCAYTVELRLKGSCETILSINDVVDTYQMNWNCSGYRPYTITAYPNPTSSELLIEAVAASAASAPVDAPAAVARGTASAVPSAAPFVATLYDKDGAKVATGSSTNGKLRLDVKALPGGLYTLQTSADKEVTSRRIQILH